jgi:hypothetical protein
VFRRFRKIKDRNEEELDEGRGRERERWWRRGGEKGRRRFGVDRRTTT